MEDFSSHAYDLLYAIICFENIFLGLHLINCLRNVLLYIIILSDAYQK